jgi:hypothetical protein
MYKINKSRLLLNVFERAHNTCIIQFRIFKKNLVKEKKFRNIVLCYI